MPFQSKPEWLVPQLPETATALPAPFYTDPDAFAAERQCVFASSWQLVAHASELSGTGDHVVTEVAGLPLIIVHGEDGELRAFHNVCRHRAGPLATCNGKGARALRCHYHAWTYTLEGQLRSAPEMGEAKDFNVSQIALPQAQVGIWHGLVFVAVGSAPPFAELLAGIDSRLGTTHIDDYQFHNRVSYEIEANWKTYVDNFLEGYHLPHIHPALNRLLDYRSYTTETSAWHSLQSSPMENSENFYGSGEALYYFIYPNTMLNILPDRLQTNRVTSLSANRCRVDFDFYYPPSADTEELKRRSQDQAFSDEIQIEDIQICESVQKGLASGSYEAGRLNPKRESGVHHFHELLRTAWREREGWELEPSERIRLEIP
ncbi:aromatic ring-hydroxylating oxygenase subunit alpha [Dokdonella sp.]|uniref:aromatic ring-hydroxylating oxygenase subunit alpha n=1 Tax=Dokdonella sp. TaxID=2291710 RepID=UPI003C39D715